MRISILRTTTAGAALLATTPLWAQTAAPATTAPQADATAVAAQPGPSTAAEDAQLGNIVVSARRRNESLQNVPIAVTAFSSERIDRDGIENIQDIAKLTPSLVFDKGFSPQDNRPSIRGLPATSGRPPVGILIDGIDTTTESIATAGGGNLMDLRLVDFDRIEVVEGPQSALYGRSAFNGAINYVTKEPGSHFGGYIGGEVGLYGRGEVRGAVDLPASDTLSFRVNGVYSTYNGYYTNTVTGNKLGGYETYGGAVAAKWTPSSDVKVLARVSYANDHEEQQATKYYGLLTGLATPLAIPANAIGKIVGGVPLPASITAYRPGYIENVASAPIALSADPKDPTGTSDYPGAHTYNIISSLRAEANLGFATLSSWTGYVHSTGSTIADVDYYGTPYTQVSLPAPGGLGEFSGTKLGNGFWQFDIHTKLQQFSQEVRLGHLDGSSRFRWAVGGLYWYEKVAQVDRRFISYGLGQAASTSLDVTLQGGRSTVSADQGRITNHVSGYALAEYDLTPKLTISAEGRIAQEKLDYDFGPSVSIRSGTNLATGPAPFYLVGSSAKASSTTTYFTPRGIISYHPTKNLLFYLSAARGIKPGGFTQVGSADPDLGKYKPERLSNYEIGAKTTLLDHRLLLNVAAFHIDYTDKQASTLIAVPLSVNPQGALSVTTNAGKAKVDGQEVNLSAILTPELVLSAGYTHLNARYTNFVYNSTAALTIARAGNCTLVTVGGTQTCSINQNGNEMEYAPRHSAQGTLTYTRPITEDMKAFLEGSALYRSKRYLDASNQWLFHAYTTFDLKIGLQTPKWSLTAYVDNVTDNRTVKSAQNLIDVASGVQGQLDMVAYMADPRTAGVRFKINF